MQFVVTFDVEDCQGGKKIRCYFQEPMFTDAEVDHIEGLGHTVIKHPEALEVVDEETFVYGPHLPWLAYLETIAIGPPAIVMGNPWTHM